MNIFINFNICDCEYFSKLFSGSEEKKGSNGEGGGTCHTLVVVIQGTNDGDCRK